MIEFMSFVCYCSFKFSDWDYNLGLVDFYLVYLTVVN